MQGIEALTAQAARAIAERDAVQANLLELEASFGKRMLDGVALTGVTRQRWESAETALRELWETFTAYTAVIDRLAELARHPAPGRERELRALLSGRPVTLTRVPAPLQRRDLADTGRLDLTLGGAVSAMRRAFTAVTEVTAAAEAVWTEMAGRLDPVAEQVARARPLLAGLDDDALAASFGDAEARLEALRGQLNADPLALWTGHRADTTAATRLGEQVAALAPRIAELDRLRREAGVRIEALRAVAGSARAERAALVDTASRAAARVTGVPEVPPGVPGPPLEDLAALAAAGRWTRLAAELDRRESELERSRTQTRDTERIVAALLDQRSELRGLLDAYKAKAARLAGSEDPELGEKYQYARDLLWTAPCDLAAAAAAVTGYQQAILARGR
ncbi:MAG: hypothetical protein FWE35_07880 [Streptosporangiales bacterium]|nr:hypothetical protein [Streptosporangiales bacterium]